MKTYQIDTNFAVFIKANSEEEALDKAWKLMNGANFQDGIADSFWFNEGHSEISSDE